jgi:hypothetical protein
MLDKEELQRDSLGSLNYLINVLHEAFLSSKNVEIQERAIVLLACYLPHHIVTPPIYSSATSISSLINSPPSSSEASDRHCRGRI